MVTARCTDTKCYFEYNGVEYGDDAESMAKLPVASGCPQANNPNHKEEIGNLLLWIEALGE